jgi:hypothetical protein
MYLFIFFTAFYALFSIGHFGGDGYEDYLTAESIVLDRNLTLLDRPYDPDELQYKTSPGIPGKNGNIYSARGSLGVPVLLTPFYTAGHLLSGFFDNVPHDYITILSVSFYNPLVTAINVLLLFVIAGILGYSRCVSVALSFIYAFCTMTPVYARTGFAEPTLVMFLLLSVMFLIRYKRSMSIVDLSGSVIALTLCLLSRLVALIFVPFLSGYFIWVTLSKGKTKGSIFFKSTIFLSGVFLGCFIAFLLNYVIYGHILSLGAYNIADNASRIASSRHFIKGLYYYLISTGKGFFIFNFPLILSFFLLGAAIRKRNRENLLFFAIFFINLIFYVKSFRRGSLFSWGPRYLMPSVPFLVIILGDYIVQMKRLFFKLILWLFSLTGFFIMLPCLFINQSKFYFFVVEKLGLEEYMINFIPDLSPVKGAWSMLTSRLISPGMPFLYSPDWRLIEPVYAGMQGYNYIDLWFVKVIEYAPRLQGIVTIVVSLFIIVLVLSAIGIIKNMRDNDPCNV